MNKLIFPVSLFGIFGMLPSWPLLQNQYPSLAIEQKAASQPAIENLPDPGARQFAAHWEGQALSAIKASRPLEAKPAGLAVVKYVFMFEGPTLDEELTNFYAYFAKNYPTALQPVEVTSTALNLCKDKDPQGCPTLSHIVFEYGLLGRNFPNAFKSNVADVLRKRYGTTALPGLTLSPYESATRIWDSSARDDEETIGILCKSYRLDSQKDCVRDRTKNFIYIKGQGLTTSIQLPQSKLYLVEGYANIVRNTEAYHNGWITFFEEKPVSNNSVAADATRIGSPEPEAPGDNGLEFQNYPETCASPEPESFSSPINIDKLRAHSAQYRKLVFPKGTPKRPATDPSYSYPTIVFFDSFNGVSPRSSVSFMDPALQHADFADHPSPEDRQRYASACIDSAPMDRAGHGLFGIGLLAARKNGIGISGLIPDYDLSRIHGINIQNNADLAVMLSGAADFWDSGQTVIANLSMSLDVDASDRSAADSLRNKVRATATSVLYITAAGEPKTNGEGLPLPANCTKYLACLGGEPNVITVAALETVTGSSDPKLWSRSNFGNEIVAIAAPGTNIISTDLVKGDSMSAEYGYSFRSGTSPATVFVTAVAAQILADNPNLSPLQVKEKILSYVRPIEGSDGVSYLLSGNGRAGIDWRPTVAAGTVCAPDHQVQSGYYLLVTGDSANIGKIAFGNGVQEFILFTELSGGTRRERRCPVHKLYRLSRTEDNQYSMFCEDASGSLRFYDSHYLKPANGSGMKCLYDQRPCMWFKPLNGGEYAPVDLSQIKDIYLEP